MNRVNAVLRQSITIAVVMGIASASGMASAQDNLEQSSIWGKKTDVSIGVVVGATPRYMGADDYQVGALPLISIQRGAFFADSIRGLGLQWQSTSGLSASVALNYDFGRDDRDSDSRPGSDLLNGMGEIEGATVADLNFAQQLLPWLSVKGEAELRIAGEQRGNRYQLGLESIFIQTEANALALEVSAHAGDGDYNQTYFGVSVEQSQNSKFARFEAAQGLYAYSTSISWLHTFNDHWSTLAALTATHYTGQVHKSPLVQKSEAVSGLVGLNYNF